MRVPEIIGWPGAINGENHDGPDGTKMADHILRTMPVAIIEPMVQKTSGGLEIYTLTNAWPEYKLFLESNGVDAGPGTSLQVIYQELGPTMETYTNSYQSSSILGGLSEGVSATAQELLFVSGKNVQQNIDAAAASGNAILSGAGKGANKVLDAGEAAVANLMGGGPKGTEIANQMRTALVNGEKIDFPMMWKGSNWSAQYDFTVRLYNPCPGNQTMHENLIIAPMAALMALGLPKTAGAKNLTYQWPFLVGLRIPGYVHLDAGYISNISVVKGGDVNDRAWNNRPGIVDIRLTISPLYSTMLLTQEDPVGNQPTLKKEIQNLRLDKSNELKSPFKWQPPLLAVSDAATMATPDSKLTPNIASSANIAAPGRGNQNPAVRAAAANFSNVA